MSREGNINLPTKSSNEVAPKNRWPTVLVFFAKYTFYNHRNPGK
jgi:hypothetical protein